MVEIKLDDNQLKEELIALCLAEVQKVLKQIELETMLMDTKQLCKALSLSWPTVEKVFLSDSEFPKMKIGKKWVFHRKKVQAYIDSFSTDLLMKRKKFT